MIQLSFTMTPDSGQTSLKITDNTGAYSVNNPGGCGTPNPALGDVTVCTLTLQFPDPATMLPSGVTEVIDLFAAGFPLSGEYIIYATDLGLDAFPDGGYSAILHIGTSDTINLADAEITFILKHFVQCCIDKLTVAALTSGSTSVEKIYKANLALQSTQYSSCNMTQALINLSYAQEVCANKCKTC